ncbi:MAG: hypothetical protein ACR2PJ_04635 [Pseudomonadales bacterium]
MRNGPFWAKPLIVTVEAVGGIGVAIGAGVGAAAGVLLLPPPPQATNIAKSADKSKTARLLNRKTASIYFISFQPVILMRLPCG